MFNTSQSIILIYYYSRIIDCEVLNMIIVGSRHIEYVSKKTGDTVKGVELAYEYTSKHWNGVAVDKVFVAQRVIDEHGMPPFGVQVDFLYSRSGRVNGFIVR